MRKVFNILENTIYIGIAYLVISILMYIFLIYSNLEIKTPSDALKPEAIRNANIYYFLEQLSRLFSVVVCYNILPRSLRVLTLAFGTITIMRLINQVLYLAHIVEVNDPILLLTEFTITLLIVWGISKYHSA